MQNYSLTILEKEFKRLSKKFLKLENKENKSKIEISEYTNLERLVSNLSRNIELIIEHS